MSFWTNNKRITVTGAKGFLGTHLIRNPREKRGCKSVYIDDLPEYDLRECVLILVEIFEASPKI